MDTKELIARIASGEDSTFELKSVARVANRLPDKDDIARELCAFANTRGGELVIGVEDDGSVTGIGTREEADKLQRHVSQIAEGLTPSLTVSQRLHTLDEHRVLVVRVPAFLVDRPFLSRRECFVRDGNRTRKATRDEEHKLVLSAERISFDEQPIEDSVAADDLDEAEAERVFSEIYPNFKRANLGAHLRAAHCIHGTHVTVAGALLFGREPARYVPGAYVTVLRFDGDVPRTTTLANERVDGTLPAQAKRTLELLRAFVPRPSARTGATREPTGGVPEQIWAEAITNALAHRDYRSRSQTRVFVFDSRVEIMNPGELLNRLTVEGVKLGGISQRRNPVLTEVLQRMRQRDSAGLGVPEIFASAAESGLPEPEIHVGNGEFRLVVHTRAPG